MARFAGGVCSENIHIPLYSTLKIFQAQMLTRKKTKLIVLFIILKIYDTQNTLWSLTEQIEKTWNDPFSGLPLI